MRRIFNIFAALAASSILVCGCDFFRTVAGRPTSQDIESARAELLVRELAAKARQDSLERVKKSLEDSLARAAARDSLLNMKGMLRTPEMLGGFSSQTKIDPGFYAVLGSFKDAANAQRYADRIREAGYSAEIIRFRTGFNSVGVCHSSDPSEFLASMARIRKEEFCPEDFWILINGQVL